MNPPSKPTRPGPGVPLIIAAAPVSDYPDEQLCWALGQVEDWLLHASTDTLDELGEFVYGPAHRGHQDLRWITECLGVAGARLRPTEPTIPDRDRR